MEIGYLLKRVFIVNSSIICYQNVGYDECGETFTLGDCYCFVFKTFIMLGSKVMPNSYSNRISFLTVITAGALIYWYWEAMVISYLAVRTTELPIVTLEDLVKNSNLKVNMIFKHKRFKTFF